MEYQTQQKHPAKRGVFKSCYKFNKYAQILCVLLLFLILLFTAGCKMTSGNSPPADEKPVTGTFFLMDTVYEYKFYGEHAQAAGDAAMKALTDLEARVSLYVEDSEISRLNEAAGKNFVTLSPDTFALLSKCVSYGRESGGVFDVTVAPLAKLWNITGENPKIPSAEAIEKDRALVGYEDILLDEAHSAAMLRREGQAVDLGGIAKGYACDVVRKAVLETGVTSGYSSIGGNLMVVGRKPDGEDFRFGVRNPRGEANEYLAVVTLPDSTMATSGDYERYFERDGVRYHHILDPATGWPGKTDLISVSVVSPDGAYADFMSTYLFLKGKAFGLENLNAFDCGLILIDKDRNVYVSDSLRSRFTFQDPTGSFHDQNQT